MNSNDERLTIKETFGSTVKKPGASRNCFIKYCFYKIYLPLVFAEQILHIYYLLTLCAFRSSQNLELSSFSSQFNFMKQH